MELTEIASYRRTVHAGLASVWDNVLDWEHLPWLHCTTFRRIRCLEAGPWGWTAEIEAQPGGPDRAFTVDLRLDRPAGRYVTRTIAGLGAGSEIWTGLTATSDTETAIDVRFLVPEIPPALAETLRDEYVRSYAQLWDEDEAMMMRREAQLADPQAGTPEAETSVALGRLAAVRSRLPLVVELGGRRYRVVELDGTLVAYATVCPHMLGPLEDGTLEDGCVRCPWHGYRFDVRTGRQADGGPLRLAPAPRVTVDPTSSDVHLGFA